jgi:hypothetical protein
MERLRTLAKLNEILILVTFKLNYQKKQNENNKFLSNFTFKW